MKKFIEELKIPIMYSIGVFAILSGYHYWQDHYNVKTRRDAAPAKLRQHIDANGHVVLESNQVKSNPSITVKSNNLVLTIDLIGGSIIQAKLPKYTTSINDKTPVSVLNDTDQNYQVVEFGVVGDYNMRYHLASKGLELAPGKDRLDVVLEGKDQQGLKVTKTITLLKDKYSVAINTKVDNTSKKSWDGHFYQQIKRSEPVVEQGIGRRTYHGMSYYQDKKHYTKLDYSDMQKQDLNLDVKGGWIAGQAHYFLTALVPPVDQVNHVFTATQGGDSKYILGSISPKVSLSPGESSSYNSTLYLGPEDVHVLDKLASGLGLTIDYGFLWFLSGAMMWLLQKIHMLVGNWGVSIILVTFIIKLVFYNFSNKSFKSMAKMSTLAPKLKQIQEEFKDDKARLQQEIMNFYREEQVNPMSGCFPMLIQLPFFIALYWMLIESIDLRQAPFFFWIQDLSAKDPYYVLPIFMGASMLAQQLFSDSKGQDPSQKQMMLIIPIVFTFVFLSFPAGLVLYMVTNNLLSMAQQSWVKYQVKKEHG